MTTGEELVAAASLFRGEPYNQASGRTNPNSGYKDCSGLVYAALTVVGVNPGRNTVSTSLETWAVNNGGRYVDREFALHHAGVGLAIWGTGDEGHIGFSVGDGERAFETPSGEGHQAGYSSFDRSHWGEFFTFPGITYDGSEEDPLAQFTEADVTRLVEWGLKNALEGTNADSDVIKGWLTRTARWGVGEAIREDDATKQAISNIVLVALDTKKGQEILTKALTKALDERAQQPDGQ